MARTYVLKNVVVNWASISKPNTTYDPMWTIDCDIPYDDVENREVLEVAGVLDKIKTGVKDKKGMYERPPFIKIRRKLITRAGDKRQQPTLVDSKLNQIDALIGNGSRCNVAFRSYDTVVKGRPQKGLDLVGVQVLELVSFEPSKIEDKAEDVFNPDETGFVAEGVKEETESTDGFVSNDFEETV